VGLAHKASGWNWNSLWSALPAAVAAAVITLVCFKLQTGYATVGFLYLIVVVLHSLRGNFVSSCLISVISFLCLDYFFIPPLFSLTISDSSDTVALVSFLVTGLVITRLTSEMRAVAVAERKQRQNTMRLYEFAEQLLVLDPTKVISTRFLELFKNKFDLNAVCLFDGMAEDPILVGHSFHELDLRTRDSYIARQNFQDEKTGVAVRFLHTGGIVAAIGFEGLQEVELLPEPLAALATVMIERSSVFRKASQAAATTEAEMLRGAMLDVLAHEFKTPLATILTAIAGFSDAGPLRSEQSELAQIVESETAHLARLTSRLLRVARLDREEVRLQTEVIDLAPMLMTLTKQFAARWPDRTIVVQSPDSAITLGDPELLKLTLAQLLDNACKYSISGSDVRVSISAIGSQKYTISIWNSGSSVPDNEKQNIFERFYRGEDAKKAASGSGLGLYVARKIALAHGGDVVLDPCECKQVGTLFRLTLPILQSEPENARELQRTISR